MQGISRSKILLKGKGMLYMCNASPIIYSPVILYGIERRTGADIWFLLLELASEVSTRLIFRSNINPKISTYFNGDEPRKTILNKEKLFLKQCSY